MTVDLILALSLFAFVASITPGPNNIMLLASGVNFGFARTIPHMLGVNFGFVLMILIVGAGIGQVFAVVPQLYLMLKVISVAYMLWLAWNIATSGPVDKSADSGAKPMTFLAAAAFQWVNPKAWAMILRRWRPPLPGQFLYSLGVMALVFGFINFPSIACWAGFGVALRDLLRDPARVRIFNYVMAGLLIASLVPVVLGWE